MSWEGRIMSDDRQMTASADLHLLPIPDWRLIIRLLIISELFFLVGLVLGWTDFGIDLKQTTMTSVYRQRRPVGMKDWMQLTMTTTVSTVLLSVFILYYALTLIPTVSSSRSTPPSRVFLLAAPVPPEARSDATWLREATDWKQTTMTVSTVLYFVFILYSYFNPHSYCFLFQIIASLSSMFTASTRPAGMQDLMWRGCKVEDDKDNSMDIDGNDGGLRM
jgi:hypothetical protein